MGSNHPSVVSRSALARLSSDSPVLNERNPFFPSNSPEGAYTFTGVSLMPRNPSRALQLSGCPWVITTASTDSGSTSRYSRLCTRYLSLSPVSTRTLLPSASIRTENPFAPISWVFSRAPSSYTLVIFTSIWLTSCTMNRGCPRISCGCSRPGPHRWTATRGPSWGPW